MRPARPENTAAGEEAAGRRQLLLSGGTRCNLTHATNARGIVAAFGQQGRFLHSALAAMGPEAVVELFEAEGVATKIEEGGKVFPRSDLRKRRAGRPAGTPAANRLHHRAG